MKCPKCSLFNEPQAEFCDCGYPLKGQAVAEKAAEATNSDERLWGFLVLIAGLLTFLNYFFGVAVLFVFWTVKRKDLPKVKKLSESVLNYWLTSLLAQLVSVSAGIFWPPALNSGAGQSSMGMLGFASVLVAVGVIYRWAGAVFSVVGLVEWNDGKIFKFPGAIRFLR